MELYIWYFYQQIPYLELPAQTKYETYFYFMLNEKYQPQPTGNGALAHCLQCCTTDKTQIVSQNDQWGLERGLILGF